MNGHGLLENINLSGIEFNSKGDSVTLHLVGMVPPYQSSRFECHNVYSFILHRPPDDQIPYYVGELAWRELGDAEKQTALEKVKYPIFDQDGAFLALKATIFSVHVEGAVCGDILAERVMVIETSSSEGRPYRRRVDASGNPLGPDDPGEFVSPLPGH
jgi:hypothetical protein